MAIPAITEIMKSMGAAQYTQRMIDLADDLIKQQRVYVRRNYVVETFVKKTPFLPLVNASRIISCQL
jgi:hypothetical protein